MQLTEDVQKDLSTVAGADTVQIVGTFFKPKAFACPYIVVISVPQITSRSVSTHVAGTRLCSVAE